MGNLIFGAWGKPVANVGGPQRIVFELAKGLLSKGEFGIHYLDLSAGRMIQNLDLEGLLSYSDVVTKPRFTSTVASFIHPAVRPYIRGMWRSLRALLDEARINKLSLSSLPDEGVVNFHGVGVGAPQILSRLRLPVIWTEHSKGSILRESAQLDGVGRNRYGAYWERKIEEAYQAFIHRSDIYIFPSKSAVELFERYTGWSLPRDRLRVTYNGVEDPTQKIGTAPPVEKDLIVSVAQHVPEKGLDWALEGLAKARKPWRWVVIGGETSWTPLLKVMVRKYGLEERVKFLGSLSNKEVIYWLARSQLVLHVPRIAIFDLVLLEAMALGKPILATPVGGNVEALGENYELFVASPEDLAYRLEEADPLYLQNIGRMNRMRYLDKFSIDSMLQSYLEVFREQLTTSTPKG